MNPTPASQSPESDAWSPPAPYDMTPETWLDVSAGSGARRAARWVSYQLAESEPTDQLLETAADLFGATIDEIKQEIRAINELKQAGPDWP